MRHEEIAADLRWFFKESRGELGLKSNFAGVIARIEGGGPGGDPHPIDMRKIEAATRARAISRVLFSLGHRHLAVLCAAYAMETEHRLVWVMRLQSEAAEAHEESRSTRPLLEWLERLCKAARQGADFERRRTFARIHAAAEKSLQGALDAYSQQQKRELERDPEGLLFRPGAR